MKRKLRSVKRSDSEKALLCKNIIKCHLSNFQIPNSRTAIFLAFHSRSAFLYVSDFCILYSEILPRGASYTLCFQIFSQMLSFTLTYRHTDATCAPPHQHIKKLFFSIMWHVTCGQLPLHLAIAPWRSFGRLAEAPPPKTSGCTLPHNSSGLTAKF